MPSAHTTLTIRNAALDLISEFPIANVNDDNAYARWMNRNVQHVVQTALRQQPWNFACEWFTLTSIDEAAFRWLYAFDLPNGVLRVLPPTVGGERGGQPIPHEVKRNRLYTSYSATQNIECVMDVQAPGEWDPLFAAMIAARLAHGLSNRFTAKSRYVEYTAKLAAQAYEDAVEINTFEGSLEPTEEFTILRVRE